MPFGDALQTRKIKGWQKRSRADYIELLYLKYKPMDEEVLGCLGDGHSDTDYRLCNGNSDLLPTLVKKDEIRYEYNQYKNKWSWVSCTIFAAVGMASDQTNYQFSYDEIHDIDESSYNNPEFLHIRKRGEGRYVKDAVDCMRKRWNNNKKLVEKYGKLASYYISKYDDEIIEYAINNLYTIDGNYCPTAEYNKDREDLMIDGTKFGYKTNGHSVDIICKDGQRSVKDSGSRPERNIYGLKHKLSEITNYGEGFYIFTLVKEDNYERIKKLNEMKAKIVNGQQINSELWELSGSKPHKDKLHDMNNFYRDWVAYIDSELKTLV